MEQIPETPTLVHTVSLVPISPSAELQPPKAEVPMRLIGLATTFALGHYREAMLAPRRDRQYIWFA
jgi:hypothetical protein